jgi:hypothetical protein
MKTSIKKIINDIISQNLLNVANTEIIELDYSLLNISFEPKENTLKETEVEVSVEKMLLGKAITKGISVSSVYVPNSFTGEIKTEKQTFNWLEKIIQSVGGSSYRLRLKYNEPMNISLKYKR